MDRLAQCRSSFFETLTEVAQSNTFSGAGAKGIAGQAAYCAAKFCIVGLIKAAAVNHAKANIR